MVNDLKLSAELGVLVLNRVITMGAGGNYLFQVIALHCLGVLLGLELELMFITQAASRVAAAAFFLTEDTEVDAGLFQQFTHSLGDLDTSIFEGFGAADPVEDIDITILGQDFNI